MSWQELILTLGQVIFIVALLPSVFTKDKPEIWTSVLTGLVAYSIGVTYTTLHMPLAAVSAGLNGVFWTILAVQKLRLNKSAGKRKAK
jgi:1,4-dihydroxy-2-naphthoate octaprenyltransferase